MTRLSQDVMFYCDAYIDLRKIVDARKKRNTLNNFIIFMKRWTALMYEIHARFDVPKRHQWEHDFFKGIATKEYSDSEVNALFEKYWTEGSEPNYDGMLFEISRRKRS